MASTITRINHTGKKNYGSDNQTQISISEECSRTNQICQFTTNANKEKYGHCQLNMQNAHDAIPWKRRKITHKCPFKNENTSM